MNVYDFDNTIYDGETVIDFYFFCLKKKPSLIKYIPMMTFMLAKYKLGKISVDELEKKASKYARRILLSVDSTKKAITEFWDKNEHKIKEFYKKNKRDDDIIISASCGFILREICNRLGIKNLICSEIDINTGEIKQVCFRTNKPIILKKLYPNISVDNFYTDSLNDAPMIELSHNAFLVKKNKITKIKEAKHNEF